MKLPFSDIFGNEGSGVLKRLRMSDLQQRMLVGLLEQLDLLA